MNWNRKTKIAGGGVLLLFFALPVVASAQFEPLVGIPGITGDGTFGDYMNAFYALSISLAGLLAVVKIIIAGAKYMLTDIVTTKEDAKSDIKGALFGLLIVLAAALILTVINPQILGNSVFLEPVQTGGGGSSEESENGSTSTEYDSPSVESCITSKSCSFQKCIAQEGQGKCALEKANCEAKEWTAEEVENSNGIHIMCTENEPEAASAGESEEEAEPAEVNEPTAEEVAAEQEALLEEGVNSNTVNFNSTENHSSFEAHYSNELMSLPGVSAPSDILGVHTLSSQEQDAVDQGEHEYSSVYQELVITECEAAGGSTVHKIQGGMSGGASYYCY